MKRIAFLLVAILVILASAFPAFAATKQIIVLSQTSDGIQVSYNILFWYPISANPVPRANGSVWIASGTSIGATAAENTAIQNGSIFEEQRAFSFAVGTAVANIEAVLQQYWTKRNAQLAGQGGNQFYGSFWDGTVWSTQ